MRSSHEVEDGSEESKDGAKRHCKFYYEFCFSENDFQHISSLAASENSRAFTDKGFVIRIEI